MDRPHGGTFHGAAASLRAASAVAGRAAQRHRHVEPEPLEQIEVLFATPADPQHCDWCPGRLALLERPAADARPRHVPVSVASASPRTLEVLGALPVVVVASAC